MNEENNLQPPIDRALHHLANTPVPKGLESRVEANLRSRQPVVRHNIVFPFANALWATGALASLLIMIAFSFARKTNHGWSETSREVRPHAEAQLEAVFNPSVFSSNRLTRAAAQKKPSSIATTERQRLYEREPAPLPTTAQEHLLIAFARAPAGTASVGISQPIADHGLGQNALFDLEHEPLPPPPESSLEPSDVSTPSSAQTSSGENQ